MSREEPEAPQGMADMVAERALLEVCAWSKAARQEARKHLLPSDFYSPHHETIYTTMLALDRHGKTVDLVTLRAALDSAGHPSHVRAGLEQILLGLTDGTGHAEGVVDYAAIVHRYALRRRLHTAALALAQRATSPAETPERLAASAVNELVGIRDAGAGDTSAVTLGELMEHEDDAPRWVIPGLLEAGDRVMLTGSEGAGKSALSRQIAVMAAAGIHPFTETVMPPIRALIVDAENKDTQVRRQVRPLLQWLDYFGAADPSDRVLIDAVYPRRINLTSDRDLSRIHQVIDAFQPGLVVIGPIYRLTPRALQTDDDAHPFLAALDTLTERGCALLVEAHAGHAQEGAGTRQAARSLRPRGSSALLGWPEFGLGLRAVGHGVADLEPWRGHREARAWPTRMRRSAGNRWTETSPDDRGTPQQAEAVDPQGALV